MFAFEILLILIIRGQMVFAFVYSGSGLILSIPLILSPSYNQDKPSSAPGGFPKITGRPKE
jgi:hypothetical protein